MSMTKEQILDAAKSLDYDDRMDIVDGLLATLPPDQQLRIEEEWAVEAERRLEELRKDPSLAIPGKQALAEMKAKLRK
jgi:putative addiction module component (TIGR02574 family)